MQLPRAAYLIIIFVVLSLSACGKNKSNEELQLLAKNSEKLPPTGSAADAPEFVRTLSLLYPQSEIYRVENRIVQKSNHALTDIVAYYTKTFAKHGFRESTHLVETSGALLQYERGQNGKQELISIDIQKLPYAENYLIRIGRSDVDYNKNKEKEP